MTLERARLYPHDALLAARVDEFVDALQLAKIPANKLRRALSGSADAQVPLAAAAASSASADNQAKEAALQLLLEQTVPVHLISTPYSVPAGYDRAAEVKADNHNPPHTFCYNPNTDAPQDGGGGLQRAIARQNAPPREERED